MELWVTEVTRNSFCKTPGPGCGFWESTGTQTLCRGRKNGWPRSVTESPLLTAITAKFKTSSKNSMSKKSMATCWTWESPACRLIPRNARNREQRIKELVAELKQTRATWDSGREALGIKAAWQRADDLGHEQIDIEDRIKDTPAMGLVGLAIKITVAASTFDGIEPDGLSEHLTASAAKDAKRLVGRVLS